MTADFAFKDSADMLVLWKFMKIPAFYKKMHIFLVEKYTQGQ